MIYNFNSIMVRLELAQEGNVQRQSSNFNSIMVRLELFVPALHFSNLLNFNSIMVRLEQFSAKKYQDYCSKFQFHYGAIGTPEVIHVTVIHFYISIPLWCDWNRRQ